MNIHFLVWAIDHGYIRSSGRWIYTNSYGVICTYTNLELYRIYSSQHGCIFHEDPRRKMHPHYTSIK